MCASVRLPPSLSRLLKAVPPLMVSNVFQAPSGSWLLRDPPVALFLYHLVQVPSLGLPGPRVSPSGSVSLCWPSQVTGVSMLLPSAPFLSFRALLSAQPRARAVPLLVTLLYIPIPECHFEPQTPPLTSGFRAGPPGLRSASAPPCVWPPMRPFHEPSLPSPRAGSSKEAMCVQCADCHPAVRGAPSRW